MVKLEDFKISIDLVRYAVNNITHRLLRSGLTVLSILIGIMAIFALVSFGQGLSKYTTDIFEEMGTNKIIIQPKAFGPPGSGASVFTDDDVKFISRINGVETALGLPFAYAEVKQSDDDKAEFVQSFGAYTEGKERDLFWSMMTVDLEDGRQLRRTDKSNVVVGYNFGQPNKIFEDPMQVGDKLIVHGIEMKIVGIMESLGNPDDDGTVMLQKDYFQEVFEQEDENYMIYAETKMDADPGVIADKIQEKLRKRYGQDEGKEDFFVQTFEDMLETFGSVLAVINGVVVLIALISVFVAAINIANTMYTSVLERTQEIGIMKAIGARNSEILKIFVIESAFIGLIGGVLGIALGWAVAKLGGAAAAAGGYSFLQPYFPIWLIVGSLLFAVSIGVGSGLLPAIQASRQKPVEALRYE